MPFIGRDGRTAFLPTSVNTSSSLKISNEGDLIVDTDTLFVDSSANRVGIGTASPSRALHINAGPTDTAMLIESTDGDVQINFKDVDSTNGVSIGCDNEDFYVRSGLTTETLRITSDGKVRVPDEGKLTFGASDDLKIYHSATQGHSFIQDEGTGNLYIDANQLYLRNSDTDNVLLQTTSAGAVQIKHNGTKKFETTTTGIDVTGTVVADGFSAGDDERIKLGAGDDLQIYHNGTHNFIDAAGSADLYVRGANILFQDHVNSNRNWLIGLANGTLELYHAGNKRIETEANGAKVTGILDVTSNLKVGAATNILVGGTALPSLTGLLGGSLRGTLGVATMHMTASDPSSPVQGQFYFNSLDQKAKIYTGSSFVDLVPAGSGGGGGGGSSSDANATFRKYTYAISSTTNSVSGAAQGETSAGSFVTGLKYTIKTPGNTDFTAIGAGNNTAGTAFVATGAGSGTGDAYNTLIYSTGGDQNVEVYVNGVKAVEGATNDYIATNGSSVNFVANLASSDVVDIQVYELLTNDAFVLAAGGTFTGNVGINTTSISNRLHVHSSGNDEGILLTQAGSHYNGLIADANRTAADNYILNLQANWDGNGVARIAFETGDDTTNKDDGRIKFFTSSSGSNPIARMNITPFGNVGIGLGEDVDAGARLEVNGEGSFSGTHHKYMYATNNGILIKGAEAGIDLIGEDAGSHAASILLRNATEGFGFVNSATGDSLILKSFTTAANDFYIHATGSQLSDLVDIVTFTKDGKVIFKPEQDSGNILQINGADTTSELLEVGITSGHAQFTATNASGGSNACGFIFRTRHTSGGTTEKLRIETSGKILHSSGSGDNQFTSRRTNVASSNGDYFFHLNAQNRTPQTVGGLGFHQDGAEDSSRFVVLTRKTGSSNVARLNVTSVGDVRINVDGSGGASSQQGVLRFYRTAYSSSMLDSRIVFDTSTGTNSQNNGTYAATIAGKRVMPADDGSSELLFYTCNSTNSFAAQERLRIASDGKIGIGIEPGEMLDIANNAGTACQMQFHDTSTGNASSDGFRVGYNGAGGQCWNFENTYFRIATANNERFKISNLGQIGMGKVGSVAVNSNSTLTVIESDSNSETICIRATNNGGNGSQPGIVFKKSDSTHLGALYADVNQEALRFSTNGGGNTRLVVDKFGNTIFNGGLASTTPVTSTTGNPTIRVRGKTVSGSSTTVDLNINAADSTSGTGIEIQESSNGANALATLVFNHGSLKSMIGCSRVATNNWGTDLRFYTHPNSTTSADQHKVYERVRIKASGDILLQSDEVDFAGTGYITALGSGDLRFRTTNSYYTALVINNGTSGNAHFRNDVYFGTNGDASGSDGGRLRYINNGNTTEYGTTIEHSTHVILTNEQGTTVQAMTLGDTAPGTNTAALWAVSAGSVTGSAPTTGQEATWQQKARVEGNGDFLHAGAISSNGSDDRLKKNKVTISNALSKVQSMEGFSYEWNEVAEKIGMADGETHLGLSAQTVQSVAPEVVVVNDCLVNPDDGTNDYMTIRYERLVPMLVEAIKEQQGIIDQLKQRLDDAGL